jgi:hypothetical protein
MECEKKRGFRRTAVDYMADCGRNWREIVEAFGHFNANTYGGRSVMLKRDGGKNVNWRYHKKKGGR